MLSLCTFFCFYSGATGLKNSYSSTDNDLAIFGIIIGAGLFGFLLSRFLPRKWAAGWWLGWALLGPSAGLSVAFIMLMLKNGESLLIGTMAGRWTLVAILAIIGLAAVTMTKWIGAVSACTKLSTGVHLICTVYHLDNSDRSAWELARCAGYRSCTQHKSRCFTWSSQDFGREGCTPRGMFVSLLSINSYSLM